MSLQKRSYLLCILFLIVLLIRTPATHSHDFCMQAPLPVTTGMGATLGCGGSAVGSFLGPVGTIGGLIIGSLLGFLVNKCARKAEKHHYGIWFNDAAADVKKLPPKTVEDIIGESKPIGKAKGPSTQYEKEGSFEDALKDFEALAPQNVQNIEKNNIGKWGTLPDGRKVVVRLESSGRVPTLEIQIPGQINKIKIRYVK